jgi:hypothetical protein
MNYDDFLLLPFSEEREKFLIYFLFLFLESIFLLLLLLYRLASDVQDAGQEEGEPRTRRRFQFFLLRWIKKFIVAY